MAAMLGVGTDALRQNAYGYYQEAKSCRGNFPRRNHRSNLTCLALRRMFFTPLKFLLLHYTCVLKVSHFCHGNNLVSQYLIQYFTGEIKSKHLL